MLKQRLIKIALLSVGALLGVAVGELGLRVAGVSYPSFFTWDDQRGFSLRPKAEGRWRREGDAYIRINSAGLRDREHLETKQPNTLRIVVLGDSFTEAKQVPLEETFWAVLEGELENCRAFAGRKVEVINFGVAGYGTAQELLTLRHQVWRYSPDVVILAFFTGNDIGDNLRALRRDPLRPYFVYQNGRLQLDDSFRDLSPWTRFRFWLRFSVVDRSRVLQVTKEIWNGIVAGLEQWRRGGTHARAEASDEPEIPGEVYLEPKGLWAEAWRITEGLVVTMQDEVNTHGAAFLVVTLTTGIQVDPDPAVRQAFMKRRGIDDLFYPDRRIKALGERQGFPVLNLGPAFQAYAEQHRVFLHGFRGVRGRGRGHWNAQGHHLAGKMINQKLCSDLSIERPLDGHKFSSASEKTGPAVAS